MNCTVVLLIISVLRVAPAAIRRRWTAIWRSRCKFGIAGGGIRRSQQELAVLAEELAVASVVPAISGEKAFSDNAEEQAQAAADVGRLHGNPLHEIATSRYTSPAKSSAGSAA